MRFCLLRKISKRKEVRRTKMLSLLLNPRLRPPRLKKKPLVSSTKSFPETTHFWQRKLKASEL